jgi:hypothetical protein
MEAMKYYLLPERRASLSSQRTTPRKSTVGQLCAVGGIDASKGWYKFDNNFADQKLLSNNFQAPTQLKATTC